ARVALGVEAPFELLHRLAPGLGAAFGVAAAALLLTQLALEALVARRSRRSCRSRRGGGRPGGRRSRRACRTQRVRRGWTRQVDHRALAGLERKRRPPSLEELDR